MNHRLGMVASLLILSTAASAAFFVEGAWYHAATRSSQYREKWPEDGGGVLYCFLKNDTAQEDGVTTLRLNGQPASEQENVLWWRAWPERLQPGEVGWITVKAVGAPLAQGAETAVEAVMQSGATIRTKVSCLTPALRLANVLPSYDQRTLYLFVRNDGKAPGIIEAVHLNAQSHAPGRSPELQAVGGTWAAAPGGVLIMKLALSEAPAPLQPLAIRIQASMDGQPLWLCTGLRAVEPGLPIGTWSSAMAGDPGGQRQARRLGIEVAVGGGGPDKRQAMHGRYLIRSMNSANREAGDPPVKQPDLDLVRAESDKAYNLAWMVRDEPDLSGKKPSLMHAHNQQYWRTDPGHPTYLNLMTMAGYNSYGHIPDIVCMDHYVMHAPNSIPWTEITRRARMEEALEYTDLLKDNTEPVRMWAWPQLSAPVWYRQPDAWGVDYQFWAHVMGGAKGLLWFKYGPGQEAKWPEQTREAERLYHLLNPIRTLCYLGEPLRNLQSDNPDVLGRTLVSEEAVLAVVLNNNQSVGGLPFRTAYAIRPAGATITAPVPAWVKPDQVMLVAEDGWQPVPFEVKAGMVVFKVSLKDRARVFVIGPKDLTPPSAPGTPRVAETTGEGAALTWTEARDNYGVARYQVLKDGQPAGEAPAPVYVVPPGAAGAYSVQALDAAGNAGPASPAATVAF